MDFELEELESVLSEHFGRTPTTTPFSSQTLDVGLEEQRDEEAECQPVDLVQYRVRSVLRELSQGSDDEDDDDNDDRFSRSDETVRDTGPGENCNLIADDSDPIMINIRKVMGGCGCNLHCEKHFTESFIYQTILETREKTKEEKDLFLMGILCNSCDASSTTKRGKKRARSRTSFRVSGVLVCKATFQMIYDVKRTVLYNLIDAVNSSGSVPRVHGNTGMKPKHALKYEDVDRVVAFLLNNAEEHGIPYPAAPRGNDNIPIVYLPSDTTKLNLHAQYQAICTQQSVRYVKLSSFKTIWTRCVPHIKIAKPRDDVCAGCERHRKDVTSAVTEEEKLTALKTMEQHIQDARKERDVYLERVKEATENPDENKHYTFDFSQCVSLPHYSRQMGPLYFLTLRKVQIFGFRISGGKQLNFLVDESETLGQDGKNAHGPNAVLSMIDWALESRCQPSQSFSIHADNCPGQNKNLFVVGYFLWRTMTGQQDKIEYLMQIPGHARCHVDSGFASLKKSYRRHNLETLTELEAVVDGSSATNVAVRYPEWCWRDWKTFLGAHFKSLTGIRKFQYFRMCADNPGVVVVKERADGEEKSINMLKIPDFRFTSADRPAPVPAAGHSDTRRDYLVRNVYPHMSVNGRQLFL